MHLERKVQLVSFFTFILVPTNILPGYLTSSNGFMHGLRTPRESFFSKIRNFWAWADKLGQKFMRLLGYFWPNYRHYFGTESVAGPLSYKKLWFLGLKHITPKYSHNKIWAVQNLENSVRTSVFGGFMT